MKNLVMSMPEADLRPRIQAITAKPPIPSHRSRP
jgi:hypothetical protein